MVTDQKYFVVPAMVFAVAVGCLAMMHTAASLWSLEAAEAADRLRSGAPMRAENLVEAFRDSQAAAGLAETARHYSESAALLSAVPAPSRDALARQGISEKGVVIAALRTEPTNPYNWARLASIRFDLGDFQGARSALLMSIANGRHAPNLAGGRARLALALSDRGQSDLATIARQQVLSAAESQPELLARYHRDADFIRYCHRLLAGNHDAHLAFINALVVARRTAQ